MSKETNLGAGMSAMQTELMSRPVHGSINCYYILQEVNCFVKGLGSLLQKYSQKERNCKSLSQKFSKK
jgi:hypothetical protein